MEPCLHHWREPAGRRSFETVAARLYWSYANLAMAHAALSAGARAYTPFPHYQIRARLYAGLNKGSMSVGPLFDDERLRILSAARCAYCGSGKPTDADHLLPKIRGGDDRGENLVPACKGCNSSKGGRDVMAWHRSRETFPSLAVTRRYLKLSIAAASLSGMMTLPVTSGRVAELPFDVLAVPMTYPRPTDLFWDFT